VGVEPGDTVVIEGPGHQGLAVLEAVLAAGAGTVIVTGSAGDELRLAAAREIGAHHTIDVSRQDPVEVVRDLTGGVGPDVVMDIASVVHTVPVAVELVRFRGRILLAGLKHFEAIPGLVTDNIVVKGLKVFGGSGFTPESMGRAVQLIEDAKVNTGAVRGEVFGLDGIEEALRLLARAEPGRDAVRVSLEHTHAG
jgi:threonine dehydrogenase-like Zn-dependent dehydrogenase